MVVPYSCQYLIYNPFWFLSEIVKDFNVARRVLAGVGGGEEEGGWQEEGDWQEGLMFAWLGDCGKKRLEEVVEGEWWWIWVVEGMVEEGRVGDFVEDGFTMGTVEDETMGDVWIWLVRVVGAEVASDRGEMAWVVWEVDVFDEGIDEGPQRMIGEVSVGVD